MSLFQRLERGDEQDRPQGLFRQLRQEQREQTRRQLADVGTRIIERTPLVQAGREYVRTLSEASRAYQEDPEGTERRLREVLAQRPPQPEPEMEPERPWLARTQADIYQRFIEPVQRTAGRFAANVADALMLGQFRGREVPSQMPEYVRQSTAPAQTTAERITDIAGQIAGSVAPVGGAYATGGRLATRALSRVAPQAPRVAQEAVRGAAAGLTYGVAREGVDVAVGVEDRPLSERARNIAIETALGGIGDPAVSTAGRYIGRIARDILERYRPQQARQLLALPEPSRDVPTETTEPRGLPEPSAETLERTRQRAQNIQEAQADLQQTEMAIRELDNQYQQAINEQYQLLRRQFETRRGVQPGGLIRDETGEVVGRFGRISENPIWYQEFYRQHGRPPTNRELYELAKKHVDEGYRDDMGFIPSWREQTQYDEIRNALVSVRDELQQGIRELSSRVVRVDEPLTEQRLRSLRRPEAPPAQETPSRPSLMEDVREVFQEMSPSQTLGISALRRRPGPYENLRTSTKSQIVSKLDREPFSAERAATQFYIDWVDDLYRLNQFDRFVERTLGIDRLPSTERPYDLALSTRGADIVAHQIITTNMVDIEGNVVGQSLKNIISRLPRGAYVDFEDYLLNRHAITRYERGEKVYRDDLNWTPEKGRENIAKLEAQYPMFRQLAEELYEFNRNLVQHWLVDTGLITQEMAERWFAENPFYVPMKRHFPETPSLATRARRGFSDQRAPVKAYSKEGSGRPIYSPIESIIENVDAFVKAAKRNQVMQAMIRNIQRSPDDLKDWIEIVPIREEATKTSIRDVNKILEDEGLEGLITRLNNDFEITFRRPAQGLDRDNIVTGMVDGRPVHVKVNDPQLLQALKALSPEGQHWLMDAIGQVTRFFKVLTTGINPVFGVTRNLFRDISQAFIARQYSTIPQFARDLVESFVSALGNGELYQRYKNIGGGHASPVAADRNLLAQSKRAILPENRLRGIIPRGFSAIENFMNALEAVPRLSEFKRAGMETAEQRLRGMLAAQDVTTNFKRRGRYARQIDQVFPYFNAAIQGLDKIVRTYKDNPVQALTRAFMSITIPTIALYAINYRNPDFQNLTPYLRDNYYMIPLSDGRYIRIAKHRELGIPFSAAVERALDQWLLEDPESFHQFADTVRIAFFPPGFSGFFEEPGLVTGPLGALQDTIAGPLLDIAQNRTFTGAPIVPYQLQRLSPELQYDETTSRISRYLGSMFGASPKQLDHLIRSYTGILGQLLIPATAPGGDLGEMLTRQVVVDPVFSSKTQNRFYEIKEQLDTAYYDAQAQAGEPLDPDIENMRQVYSQVDRIMSELRKASRQIEESDIPNQQKRKYIRDIRARINELAQLTNQVYRENMPNDRD